VHEIGAKLLDSMTTKMLLELQRIKILTAKMTRDVRMLTGVQ